MNPGPTEVATGFLDAMRSQPVMLGLVVMNLAMVAMLYTVLRFTQEQRTLEFDLIFKAQADVRQILSLCVVPKDGG